MKIDGTHYRTVWMEGGIVKMINQAVLPHIFQIVELRTHQDTARAIRDMIIRGAGAIGGAGGYGMAQVVLEAPDDNSFTEYVERGADTLARTRPTAQNLFYAIDRALSAVKAEPSPGAARRKAVEVAEANADEDAENCAAIGRLGAALLKDGDRLLTHCNRRIRSRVTSR